MHFILFVTILIFPKHIYSIFYKENITDLSKCKIHFSKSEGKYTDFFQITTQPSDDLIFDFHFSVLAQSDAHILLTPSKIINAYDPVYEIVLGAGKNSYSSIRRAIRSKIKSTTRHTTKLLSVFEPQSFWIHVSKDGLIEIGRETQDIAFLAWKDPDPLPLEYFSLSTWPGIEAKWFFDCNRNITKEVERVLNDRERLVDDYLKKYPIFDVPLLEGDEKIDVYLSLKPLFMKLNEQDGKLESKFIMIQKWIDPKLKWNPNDYGNIESIHPHFYQIWTPNMRFFSVVDEFQKNIENTKLFLKHDGQVILKSNLDLTTWCKTADLDDWPEDKHICKFPIGFFIDSEKINLYLSTNHSEMVKNLSYKTEWDIDKVDFNEFNPENNDEANLEVNFYLKRISKVYKLIYSAPIIIISVSTILIFCVSPFGYLKLTLASFNLCLNTLVLVQMALNIPGHPERVPKILLAYNYGYLGIILSIFLSIITINISRNKQKKMLPRKLFKFLMNEVVQKLFSLFIPKDFIEDPIQQSWVLLACFIDRISFITFLIWCSIELYAFII